MGRSTHLYADRIRNVAITGPLIRIELGAMAAPSGEGQSPELAPTETVVMPLDGFLASFGMLETVVKKLIADGVVTQRQPEAATGA